MNNVTERQNRFPLKIKPEAVSYLSSLRQFRGVHTVRLIKLAHRRTGLPVPSRWVAISLLRSNLGPIPVADLEQRPKKQEKPAAPTPRAKLILVKGSRSAPTKRSPLGSRPRSSTPFV